MAKDFVYTYYFMYGSPVLGFQTFDRQFATCRPEGQARLDGWRMDFSRDGGRPNLVREPEGRVFGLVWLIETAELPALDRVEGGARQEGQAAWLGKSVPCVFYTFPEKQEKPGSAFISDLRVAYKVAMLPQKQIDNALGIELPDEVRGDTTDTVRPVR